MCVNFEMKLFVVLGLTSRSLFNTGVMTLRLTGGTTVVAGITAAF